MDTSRVLQAIYLALPLYSEEGNESTVISRNTLLETVSAAVENEIDCASISASVNVVEKLLIAISVLDDAFLQNGRWKFVSYPASLIARSLVKTISDPEQLMCDKSFWSQQDSNSPVSEQQRQILGALERNRSLYHNRDEASPVRFVTVAWGLIVIDGKVLLRHREDRNRANRNNYVLVGGRLSQADLRRSGEENPLLVLQSPDAASNKAAVETALKREISEETGLQFDEHYQYSEWRNVKPYKAVEGAGANHALTEYRISIYSITLNREGFFALLTHIAEDSDLTWFKFDEFADAKNAEGKMAYINALVNDFSSREDWVKEAHLLPSSYLDNYTFLKDSDAITFAIHPGEKLEYGKTGKEKAFNIGLDDIEQRILLGLALFTKGMPLDNGSLGVSPVSGGWIRVSDLTLRKSIEQLSRKLSAQEIPLVEGYRENLFRLTVHPDQCFFADTAFTLGVSDTEIELKRAAIETEIGNFSGDSLNVPVSRNLAKEVKSIASGAGLQRYSPEDLSKMVRRDIRPSCQEMGLRTLVRTISGEPIINIRVETSIE